MQVYLTITLNVNKIHFSFRHVFLRILQNFQRIINDKLKYRRYCLRTFELHELISLVIFKRFIWNVLKASLFRINELSIKLKWKMLKSNILTLCSSLSSRIISLRMPVYNEQHGKYFSLVSTLQLYKYTCTSYCVYMYTRCVVNGTLVKLCTEPVNSVLIQFSIASDPIWQETRELSKFTLVARAAWSWNVNDRII